MDNYMDWFKKILCLGETLDESKDVVFTLYLLNFETPFSFCMIWC